MEERIIEIALLLLTLIGSILKSNHNTTRISNILNKQIEGDSRKLVTLSMDIQELLFDKRIKNALNKKTTNIIRYETSLDCKYHSLLSNFADAIKSFASDFYYSDLRNNANEIAGVLKKEIEKIIANFENNMNYINPNPKVFLYSTGKKEWVSYKDLIYKSGIYSKKYDTLQNTLTDKLLQKLIDNGLDAAKICELFTQYIDEVFSIVIEKSIHFERECKNE